MKHIRRSVAFSIILGLFIAAGCTTRREVVPKIECFKIIGEKYYERRLLGLFPEARINHVVILEDGSEMPYEYAMYIKDRVTDKLCRTTYIPKQPR